MTIIPLPKELVESIGAARLARCSSNVVFLEDTQPAVDAVTAFLRTEATPAIQGQGGDAQTVRTAQQVRDRGVSEKTCAELMFQFYNERCSPTWDWEELSVKVANAYRYATGEAGYRNPENTFEPVDAEPDLFDALMPTPAPRPKLFFEMADDVEPDLADDALIDDTLGRGTMSVVYGASNVGKTFVAMSGFAYSVATGAAWNGNKVVQGAVVYIAAEAGSSARKRVKAMRLHHRAANMPFALVPCPVDLLRPAGECQAIIDLVAEVEKQAGQKVVLIVIDTLSRALSGGNENSPEDMGAFVMNADKIRVRTGAHVMVIHHSGKDDAKGARGHSLLRAATDTEIEVTDGKITATKQRDIPQQAPVSFSLVDVPLGNRPDGRPVSSAVAVFGHAIDFPPTNIYAVQARIASDEWAENIQAPNWAGNAIADVLGIGKTTAADKKYLKALIKQWVASNDLQIVVRHDTSKGRSRSFITVGVRHELPD